MTSAGTTAALIGERPEDERGPQWSSSECPSAGEEHDPGDGGVGRGLDVMQAPELGVGVERCAQARDSLPVQARLDIGVRAAAGRGIEGDFGASGVVIPGSHPPGIVGYDASAARCADAGALGCQATSPRRNITSSHDPRPASLPAASSA